MKIESKLYSPDSTKIVVTYVYDYGALGQSRNHISIINNGELIPKFGNLIEEGHKPKMEWISNDSLKINCDNTFLDEIRDWSTPQFRGITLIYYNDNSPFRLHKKYYFSDYKVLEDSSITFKSGLWNFIYYMKSDDDYTFPIKSLGIISNKNELVSIQVSDDILFAKTVNITEGRDIVIKYFPKIELIPSLISDEKIKKLERLIKRRI